jgi:hypothetical protein
MHADFMGVGPSPVAAGVSPAVSSLAVADLLISIPRPPATNPDPVVAYTSQGRRPACAAILLGAGPNTTPRHFAMIRSSFERNACLLQAPQCVTQFCPRRIKNGQMIEPSRSPGRRPAAVTLPSVQSDVMMIPAGREKCRRRSETLRQLKPKHIAIKSKRTLQSATFKCT